MMRIPRVRTTAVPVEVLLGDKSKKEAVLKELAKFDGVTKIYPTDSLSISIEIEDSKVDDLEKHLKSFGVRGVWRQYKPQYH